jgi:hypothetical protein
MLRRALPFVFAMLSVLGCGDAITPVTSYTVEDGSDMVLKSAAYGGSSIAQSLTLTIASGTQLQATTASIKLKRTGTFTLAAQTLTLTLVSDSSGSPGLTVLATASLDPATVGTSAAYYSFSFSGVTNITTSGTYWLKLTASFPLAANTITWSGHNNAVNGYSGGVAKYDDGVGAWSSSIVGSYQDLVFELNGNTL